MSSAGVASSTVPHYTYYTVTYIYIYYDTHNIYTPFNLNNIDNLKPEKARQPPRARRGCGASAARSMSSRGHWAIPVRISVLVGFLMS